MKNFRALLLVVFVSHPLAADYQPLEREGAFSVQLTEFSYQEREVPLKVYLPETTAPAPVILLSHGLGGSREVGTYLGELWASRGFVVVAMQHLGSDHSVWKDAPPAQRRARMKAAASGQAFRDRTQDVPATLDQLELWQREEGHFLAGRLDLERVGIGGHSFGAKTTQALAGQSFGLVGKAFHDERIDAALALSPSPPKQGDPAKAFSQIAIPMMLMTGTADGSPIGSTTPAARREVFPALPAGDKYELVLRGAEHHAFSDHRTADKRARNPNHHRVIQALSVAFWEAYLLEDAEAVNWLQGEELKTLLAEGDLWQRK